jgi:hypothetical protein
MSIRSSKGPEIRFWYLTVGAHPQAFWISNNTHTETDSLLQSIKVVLLVYGKDLIGLYEIEAQTVSVLLRAILFLPEDFSDSETI